VDEIGAVFSSSTLDRFVELPGRISKNRRPSPAINLEIPKGFAWRAGIVSFAPPQINASAATRMLPPEDRSTTGNRKEAAIPMTHIAANTRTLSHLRQHDFRAIIYYSTLIELEHENTFPPALRSERQYQPGFNCSGKLMSSGQKITSQPRGLKSVEHRAQIRLKPGRSPALSYASKATSSMTSLSRTHETLAHGIRRIARLIDVLLIHYSLLVGKNVSSLEKQPQPL